MFLLVLAVPKLSNSMGYVQRELMKRVYTANPMSADQEIVKGLLDDAGIPCMTRNENLSTALGELLPRNLDSE